ncbi:ISAzo13-like element transposase-related protein [Succinimonas amylolytica]|uniref:ISAzo13-like element transposase-related protein n=1 Tax=Succinimonas amylolytica TaxID=83769 RepID=UPI003CCBFC9F
MLLLSKNWKGKPLETIEKIVNLIYSTYTTPHDFSGLKSKCVVDHNENPKGVKVSDEDLNEMNIS